MQTCNLFRVFFFASLLLISPAPGYGQTGGGSPVVGDFSIKGLPRHKSGELDIHIHKKKSRSLDLILKTKPKSNSDILNIQSKYSSVPFSKFEPKNIPGLPETLYCGPNFICGPSSRTDPVGVIPELRSDDSDLPPTKEVILNNPYSRSSSQSSSKKGFPKKRGLGFSFSYVVALLKNDKVLCSGTLIGESHILTAAHCACNVKPDEMFLGSSTVTGDPTDRGNSLRKDLKPNPIFYTKNFCKFSKSSEKHNLVDLAILKTESPIEISNSYFISAFMTLRKRSHYVHTIVGFGASNQSNAGGVKRYASITPERCDKSDKSDVGCIPDREYFVKNQRGFSVDTCKGDSGGPLLRGERYFGSGSWSLLGITSRKIKGGREKHCGSGGIYVDTTTPEVQKWLRDSGVPDFFPGYNIFEGAKVISGTKSK